MLYLTTRDGKYAYTAHKTLCSDVSPDGGIYIPYKLPDIEKNQMQAMLKKPFSDVVAQVLNMFFSAPLDARDIELRIGRTPLQLIQMNRKIAIAELWRNPGSGVEHIIEELYQSFAVNPEHSKRPTMWARVIIRIAILFGICAQLRQDGNEDEFIDISVNMQDITEFISAWYARAIGLPLGQIICCCDAGDGLWDILHGSSLNTRNINDSQLTVAELLTCETLGHEQAQRLISVASRKGTFSLSEEEHAQFAKGIYPVAIGPDRSDTVISSVRSSTGYIIDSSAAITYGGLQDYRAQTGESCLTILLAQFAPENI